MSTLLDYAGRTVDVSAFRGLFPAGREQLLAQELVTPRDGGALVTGIEKLAQKVLVTLLQRKGSKLYAPEDGTDFMTHAERGLWRTVADVRQSFLLARLDVRQALAREERPDDPDDEKFAGMTLDGVTLAGDKVTLRITLTSAAGDQYKLLTPIKVAIK